MPTNKIFWDSLHPDVVNAIQHPMEDIPTVTETQLFADDHEPRSGWYKVTYDGAGFLPSKDDDYMVLSTVMPDHDLPNVFEETVFAIRLTMNDKTVTPQVFILRFHYDGTNRTPLVDEGQDPVPYSERWDAIGGLEVVDRLDIVNDKAALSANMGANLTTMFREFGTVVRESSGWNTFTPLEVSDTQKALVKIDNDTIQLNAYGQLELDPLLSFNIKFPAFKTQILPEEELLTKKDSGLFIVLPSNKGILPAQKFYTAIISHIEVADVIYHSIFLMQNAIKLATDNGEMYNRSITTTKSTGVVQEDTDWIEVATEREIKALELVVNNHIATIAGTGASGKIGHVKVDGTSITVDADGMISASGGNITPPQVASFTATTSVDATYGFKYDTGLTLQENDTFMVSYNGTVLAEADFSIVEVAGKKVIALNVEESDEINKNFVSGIAYRGFGSFS